MDQQTPKPDPDLNSLEMFSQSLESRNKALRKILMKLQQDSENNLGFNAAVTDIKTDTDSEIHNS
jgi:hypothetical protein